MPRFYSATEEDAMKYILEHMPKQTGESTRLLAAQVDSLVIFPHIEFPPSPKEGVGRACYQPLFRPSPRSESNLLTHSPEPPFSISHDTVFDHRKQIQDKLLLQQPTEAPFSRSSDVREGKVWHQRVSSEPSSPDYSWDDGNDHGPSSSFATDEYDSNEIMKHSYGLTPHKSKSLDDFMLTRPSIQPSHDTNLHEHDDIANAVNNNTEVALKHMDIAFNKWSYARREGIDAVNEVFINAPSQLHAIMAYQDENVWSHTSLYASEATGTENCESQEHSHLPDSVGADDPHNENALIGLSPTSKEATERIEKRSLNRVELIAREKAANDTSILSTQSASQKRSARYKNKNRRKPIMPPPYHIKAQQPDQEPEPESKAEPQEETKPKCTIFMFNKSDTDARQALDRALKTGTVNVNNESHIENLFQVMNTFRNSSTSDGEPKTAEQMADEGGEGHGKGVGEAKDDEQTELIVEGVEKKKKEEEVKESQRKKGRAGKESKKNQAK